MWLWLPPILKKIKMVSSSKIESFILEWQKASKPELRARLKSLKTKPKTSSVIAEIKAIQALLN